MLSRHHTRFERTFHRCLKELKALQTNRAQKEEASSVAPKTKISKQTQSASRPEPEEHMTPEESADLERIFQMMDEKFGPPKAA